MAYSWGLENGNKVSKIYLFQISNKNMGFLQKLTNEKLFALVLILAGLWLIVDQLDETSSLIFNFSSITRNSSTTRIIQTVADPLILIGIGIVLILLGLK